MPASLSRPMRLNMKTMLNSTDQALSFPSSMTPYRPKKLLMKMIKRRNMPAARRARAILSMP